MAATGNFLENRIDLMAVIINDDCCLQNWQQNVSDFCENILVLSFYSASNENWRWGSSKEPPISSSKILVSFHPTVAPLSEVSLWTDEGNKVWMCTHTNKLSQWWIQVKTTKYLDIYLGDPSVWYDLDEMFDVSATWIDDYVCTYSLHLYVSVTRQSEGNDCRNRVMSKYIISTYGALSLLQALDSFVSSQSQVAIAILSQSYSLHTINHLWIYWIMTYCFKSSA